MPFSYPFTGEPYLVSRNAIIQINASATEVMKFLVAGGVADVRGFEDE